MAPEPTNLLWLDLETTGTDEKLDPILEVGCILTDMRLQIEPEFDARSWVSQWTEQGEIRLQDNEYVRNMHTENGLLELAQDPRIARPLAEIDARLVDLLQAAGVRPHRLILAGSGVGHFDMRFIRAQMPTLASMLQYSVIDIGVIRRFARDICGYEPPDFTTGKTHRSIDDARLHLAEARWWRTNMMGLFERIHG